MHTSYVRRKTASRWLRGTAVGHDSVYPVDVSLSAAISANARPLLGPQAFNLTVDGGGATEAPNFNAGGQPLELQLSVDTAPLDCTSPSGRTLSNDTIVLYLNLHTPQNLFHQHNDNLLPLALAALQLGWIPTLNASLSSRVGGPRRLVLVVGPTSPLGWSSHPFLSYALDTAFDEVIATSALPSGGLCVGTARLGRPLKVFWTSWSSAAQYAASGAVRVWSDYLVGRAGLSRGERRTWPPKLLFVRRTTTRTLAEDDEEYLRIAFAEAGVEMRSVAMENLSPREQLQAVSTADVMIGVHGAGLTHAIYMRPGSLLVQLLPTNMDYWEAALFQRLALLAGLSYYEVRNPQ